MDRGIDPGRDERDRRRRQGECTYRGSLQRTRCSHDDPEEIRRRYGHLRRDGAGDGKVRLIRQQTPQGR
ncbi:hypothetical protein [Brevinema andersonii]|uniref:hypothetical protein n=1 Tax=Brevinema andersonii TaxID=34097 RepID=UPI001177E9CE|nr:hypothetical protein [Brevinema andersonii]